MDPSIRRDRDPGETLQGSGNLSTSKAGNVLTPDRVPNEKTPSFSTATEEGGSGILPTSARRSFLDNPFSIIYVANCWPTSPAEVRYGSLRNYRFASTCAGWRFKVGIALFALMILAWLLIPIEAALGMSAGTIAATTAGIAIGNKIILVLAIAVMGKAGFQELKAKLFHKLTPPSEVSPMRYRIGLVMFCLPFLQGLLETWASHIAPQSGESTVGGRAMDAMMIASLFVLGGNFWDKLRALFFVNADLVMFLHVLVRWSC